MHEGELDIVNGPVLERRADVATLGIRETVPFRTMLSNRDRLLTELIDWLAARGIEPSGSFFLRLHVVDMSGLMDIEVGVEVEVGGDIGGERDGGGSGRALGAAEDRVRAGSLPAGDYAVLAYRAKSMAANRRLHAWVAEQGLVLDTRPDTHGEAFASRCEIYRTDPRTEPRKTRWVVELAFKTRAEP